LHATFILYKACDSAHRELETIASKVTNSPLVLAASGQTGYIKFLDDINFIASIFFPEIYMLKRQFL